MSQVHTKIPAANARHLFGLPISRNAILWANAYRDPRFIPIITQNWLRPAALNAVQS
jgi:hypothetical protein